MRMIPKSEYLPAMLVEYTMYNIRANGCNEEIPDSNFTFNTALMPYLNIPHGISFLRNFIF